jgi:hypothetical protein
MRAYIGSLLATGMASLAAADDRVITIARETGYRSPPPHRYSRGTPVKPYRASGPVMAEGSKAAARRRRQIERGQLKAENGLARG